MTPTDQIATIITAGEACKTSDAIAQNVVDALPGMLPDLEWDGFNSGPYQIEVSDGSIADLIYFGAPDEDGQPETIKGGFLTLISIDELKAAANAHHRATWIAQLTGETE